MNKKNVYYSFNSQIMIYSNNKILDNYLQFKQEIYKKLYMI